MSKILADVGEMVVVARECMYFPGCDVNLCIETQLNESPQLIPS